MKRILLFCSLLLATTFTVNNAQAQSGRPVLATKSVFSAKIADMNDYIDKGKITDANQAMDDLNVMIGAQLRYSKYEIKDAETAKDSIGFVDAKKNLMDKWNIYNDMSNLTSNLTLNKSKINLKLSDFMKVMD